MWQVYDNKELIDKYDKVHKHIIAIYALIIFTLLICIGLGVS